MAAESTAPLRRGEFVNLILHVTVAGVTRDVTAPTAPSLSINVGRAGLETVGCLTSAVAAMCTVPADQTLDIACAVPLQSGLQSVRLPMVLSMALQTPNVQVAADASTLNWSGAVESKNHSAPTANLTLQAATVFSTVPGVVVPTVRATMPPMNRLAYGGTLTVVGKNLHLLPAQLPLGPAVAPVTVAANGKRATVDIPATVYTRPAAVPADLRSALVSAQGANSEKAAFVCHVLNDNSVSSIRTVLDEAATGAAPSISRFNVDFQNAQVELNVVRGRPPPEAPALYPSSTGGGVIIPVFVADMSTVNDAMTVQAMLQHGNVTYVSTGVDRVEPVMTAAGAPDGGWIFYVFPEYFTVPVNSSTNASVVAATSCGDANATGNATAVIGGGPALVPVQMRVVNHARHTETTVVALYRVPTFSVAAMAQGLHRVRLTMRLENTAPVHRLRVLIYSDTQRSVRLFPTKSNDATCAYDARNFSTLCSLAQLGQHSGTPTTSPGSNGTWTLDFFATVPAYFSSDVVARVHVFSADAGAKDFYVRLATSASRGVLVAVAAPSTVAMTCPDAPTMPSALQNVTALAVPATTAAPQYQQAIVRGIFSIGAGCDTAVINFIVATLIVFAVIIVARVVHSHYARRHGQTPDTIRTYDAMMWPSLLPQHVYLSLVKPCHHYCGPTHGVQGLVHVLAMYAVASTMLQEFRHLAGQGYDGLATAALATVVGAACVQPVVDSLFNQYRTVDERAMHAGHAPRTYEPQDLVTLGAPKLAYVGVSSATMDALGEVDHDECDVVMDFDSEDSWGATLATSASPKTSEPLDIDGRVTIDGFVIASPRRQSLRPGVEATSPRNDSLPSSGPHSDRQASDEGPTGSSRSVQPATAEGDEGRDQGDLAAARNVQAISRDLATCVVVHSRRYTIAGYLLGVFVSVLLLLLTAKNIATWCAPEYKIFWTIMLVALCADFVLMQPAMVGMTYAWRWLNADGDDIIHELHPIDKQWRHVGAIDDEFVEATGVRTSRIRPTAPKE